MRTPPSESSRQLLTRANSFDELDFVVRRIPLVCGARSGFARALASLTAARACIPVRDRIIREGRERGTREGVAKTRVPSFMFVVGVCFVARSCSFRVSYWVRSLCVQHQFKFLPDPKPLGSN